MNVDEQIRASLVASTEDVVGGPDLGRAVREGRRRRRRHAATIGVAALAVTGLAVGTAYQMARGSSDDTARDRTDAATSPAYHDFVPGTDIDEQLQAVVGEDLPGAGDANLVLALDIRGHTVADWQDANKWVLRYKVGVADVFVHVMKPTGSGVACVNVTHSPNEGEPDCTRVELPSGGYVVSDSFVGVPADSHNRPIYVFASTYVRPDGSMVDVRQSLWVDTWHQAVADRAYTPDQLRDLLTDPRMDFPDPAS
jgi:hypothetical protein